MTRVTKILASLGIAFAGLLAAGCDNRKTAPTTQPVLRIEEVRNNDGTLHKTWSYYLDSKGKKVKHGPEILYYREGHKYSLDDYEHGELNGRHVKWHWLKPDQEEIKGQWRNGKREGEWTEWHSSWRDEPQRMRARHAYKKGIEVGETLYWNDRGQLVRKDMRDSSGTLREFTFWHENGRKYRHGTLDKKERRDGTWTYWDENEKVVAEGQWRAGKPWEGICGVLEAGDAGSWGGLEQFGRYRGGSLKEPVPRPTFILSAGGTTMPAQQP